MKQTCAVRDCDKPRVYIDFCGAPLCKEHGDEMGKSFAKMVVEGAIAHRKEHGDKPTWLQEQMKGSKRDQEIWAPTLIEDTDEQKD